MERETELQLVANLKAGDEAAFDTIYAHFRPRLFGYLVRLSRSQAVAEDLLQETWIRLATRAPRLRDDTRLAAWLFTVARNLFLSYRRWRLLDAGRVSELARVDPAPAGLDCPFEAVAASELEGRLERALAHLPLRYREVLLLCTSGEMDPAEVAQVCELKPAAFRMRLSRARAMLADKLSKNLPAAAPATSECGS